MPSNFGSKFLGEERYQQYVDELTAEGTLDGKKLSPDERKEGFKKRNDKIGFEQFVNKVLDKKETAPIGGASGKALPGSGRGGALVKAPGGGALAKFIQSPVAEVGESVVSILNSIAEKLDSIIQHLRDERKLEDKSAELARRGAERSSRDASEKKLEGAFTGLKKATEKIVAPVKGILDRVLDFITKILLGNILLKIVDWFGDKENQSKIKTIFRFIEDFWPALTAAVLLFGTSFGGIVRGLIGTVVRLTGGLLKVIPKFAKFFMTPLGAALGLGAAVVGGAAYGLSQQATTKSNDPDAEEGQTQLDDTIDFGGTTGAPMSADMFGFGQYNKGGLVPGGGPNKDTVPAMLTPGEFVMSRGAVQRYGTSTLESMNSASGGTNIPEISQSFTTYLKGGGLVGDYKENIRDPILQKKKRVRAMINAPAMPKMMSQPSSTSIVAILPEMIKEVIEGDNSIEVNSQQFFGGDSNQSNRISINAKQNKMNVSGTQVQRAPIGQPVRRQSSVSYLPVNMGGGGDTQMVSNSSSAPPSIPNFSAATSGSRNKLQTLGIG